METYVLLTFFLMVSASVAVSDVHRSPERDTRAQDRDIRSPTASSPLEIVVGQLSQRMDGLEAENQALKAENQAMKTHISSLQTDVSTLQAENQAMKQTQTASENKMNLMETEVNMLFNQLQSCSSDVHKLTTRVTALQTDSQLINQTIVTLETENQVLVQNVSQLKADSVAMVTQTARVQTDVETVKADSNVIRQELETLRQDNVKVKTDLTSKINTAARSVSFHAWLDSGPYGNEDTLTGNHTFTNDGNAYDENSGVFTVPVSGTYVFLVTVTVDSASEKLTNDVVRIFVDGVYVSKCWSSYIDRIDTGSCHAILKLTVGQRVWLRNAFGSATYYSDVTSFSGALLHADLL